MTEGTDVHEVNLLDFGDTGDSAFDFEKHRQAAIDAYQPVVGLYEDFAHALRSILRTCVDAEEITVHSITGRAKDLESFSNKAIDVDPDSPGQPMYPDPTQDITDLAGARVITFFLSTVERIDPIISGEFDVIEKTDKSALLQEEEKLGYQSIHYLVTLRDNRCSLPEYARFEGLVAEIQVRTILQHAWAEIEHDIQYKAVSTLPAEIRRRFMTLAGLLEIADREFQALEDEDKRLRKVARESVAAGKLTDVEITPDALKSYLDQKYGPDGRMVDWSYSWEARLLRRLGFENLEQLDIAISDYDDDKISRLLHGGRQGQISRLDDVLLAAMGSWFIDHHPWSQYSWFRDTRASRIERLQKAGVEVREYQPHANGDSEQETLPQDGAG